MLQRLEILRQYGICPHPVTIVRKAEQLGKDHDKEAVLWKNSIEESDKKPNVIEVDPRIFYVCQIPSSFRV